MDCTAISAPSDGPYPMPPLEDWSALVTELAEQHGMSQRQIAAHCHCGQTAISELARGVTNDPKHRLGEALRALRDAKRSEATQKGMAPPRPSNVAVVPMAAGAGG